MTTTTKIPLKHIALLFTILFLIQCPVAAIVTQDGSVEYQPDKQEIQYDIALPADTPKYQADEIQHNIQQNAQDRIKINQNTRDVFDTQNPSEQQTQDSTNDWIHIQSSSNSDTFAYNHPLSKTESLEKSTQESITDSLVKNTANTYNSKNSIQTENPPEINTQESWFYWKIALVIIAIILIIAIIGAGIIINYNTNNPRGNELNENDLSSIINHDTNTPHSQTNLDSYLESDPEIEPPTNLPQKSSTFTPNLDSYLESNLNTNTPK
jgi:hypothetical protein